MFPASFALQNINCSSFLTLKPVNMLRSILFVVFLLLNTLCLLFFAVYLLIASAELVLSHLILQKHHLYLPLAFLTTLYLFYWLSWGFQTVNTYTAPSLFVRKVQKRNCHIYVSTLTNENVTFFVVWLSLNMFCLPFSGILTSKCINDRYLVAVFALNMPTTPYFFVYNR